MALPGRRVAGGSRAGCRSWQRVFLIRDSQSEKENLLVQGEFLLFGFSFLFQLKGVPGEDECHWKRKFSAIKKRKRGGKQKLAQADTCLPPPSSPSPKRQSQLQRIQQVFRLCCLWLHESQSWESWSGRPVQPTHFPSSPWGEGWLHGEQRCRVALADFKTRCKIKINK